MFSVAKIATKNFQQRKRRLEPIEARNGATSRMVLLRGGKDLATEITEDTEKMSDALTESVGNQRCQGVHHLLGPEIGESPPMTLISQAQASFTRSAAGLLSQPVFRANRAQQNHRNPISPSHPPRVQKDSPRRNISTRKNLAVFLSPGSAWERTIVDALLRR